ncbi:hypothetical protein HYX08_06765 [Candidatus Woesearchaeota archaeon]|nr:hypothetical protein [Candidatus Woesearchaeota archaeon]
MSTETKHGTESGHGVPGTLDALVGILESSLNTPAQFENVLREYKIPKAEDGKGLDIPAAIRYISEKGKAYAAGNHLDPLQTTPTDIDIKRALETEGFISNGILTQAGINAVLGLYVQSGTAYAGSNTQNSILRNDLDGEKGSSAKMAAGSGNHDAIPDIKGAKDQEGLLRAVGPSINDILEKARAAFSRGKIKQYVSGLKEYFGGGHGTPAYAGAGAHQ